jgi:hypothetical protein
LTRRARVCRCRRSVRSRPHCCVTPPLGRRMRGPSRPRSSACCLCWRVISPVLLAIDDVQWIDPASETALGFALRRFPRGTGLLATRRVDTDEELSLGLERGLSDVHLELLALRPLSLGALHRIIGNRLGISLTRSMLVRVGEVSHGNPFYALEIARELPSGVDSLRASAPLPVPAATRRIAARRVEGSGPRREESCFRRGRACPSDA